MGLTPILPDDGEEEVELKHPKLQTMPVLPGDYPLFDWADWPQSHAALAPGIPTTRFEKKCWNAIVDTLGDAMEAAGLDFYKSEEGFVPENIHIPGKRYGVLTADRMNDLIWAIDDVVHFNWPWQTDVMHPGYVNKWDYIDHGFFGKRTNNKKEANIIYAQYILDIVHRLNLILQLMRGNYPYHNDVEITLKGKSKRSIQMRTGKSARVAKKMIIPLLISPAPLRTGMGMPAAVRKVSYTLGEFDAELHHAAPLRIPLISMRYLFETEIRRQKAARFQPRSLLLQSGSGVHLETTYPVDVFFSFLLHSQTAAEMGHGAGSPLYGQSIHQSLPKVQMHQSQVQETSASLRMLSGVAAEAVTRSSTATDARVISSSRAEAYFSAVKLVNTEAALLLRDTRSTVQIQSGRLAMAEPVKIRSATKHSAQIPAVPSAPVKAESISNTAGNLTVLKPRTRPLWAEQGSRTAAEFGADLIEPVPIAAGKVGRTIGACVLGSAWDPPAWHEGGLWIRQARTIKMKTDGSMDLSGSGDPISAVQESRTVIAAALDNAWLAPVWVDGGLYIRQVRQTETMEDGSLDLTGAGDEMLVQHRSQTAAQCVLDTAWYPPVMVDGGLYISQVQSAVQRENNELEVQ